MTIDELESFWGSLQPPQDSSGISGRRASGVPPHRPVYLAIDGRRRRHLLIQIPDGTSPLNLRETKSLQVTTERFQVGANPESLYIDLVCADLAQQHTFSAVAQDLIRIVQESPNPVRDAVANALSRWQSFWSSKATGLSREDALGLFGELWFLRRWLGEVRPCAINCWQATNAARHDFQWDAASIEVKTATSQNAGPPTHHVSSLDQLAAPDHGDLFLFSLQVFDDALAANTLHSIVADISKLLAGEFQALLQFNEKLSARGYSPTDREVANRQLRVIGERMYRIDELFPRLTRRTFEPEGVPVGIANVEYLIDLTACEQWLIATSPIDANAVAVAQLL